MGEEKWSPMCFRIKSGPSNADSSWGCLSLHSCSKVFLKHLGSALKLKCIGRCFIFSCLMTTELQFPAALLTMKHDQNRTRCIYYLTRVCYHPMLPPQWLRAFKNIFLLQICSAFPTFSFIKSNTTKYLQKYSTPVTSICNGFSVGPTRLKHRNMLYHWQKNNCI